MKTGLALALAAALASCSPEPPPPPPPPPAPPAPPEDTPAAREEPAAERQPVGEAGGVWAVKDESGQPFDLVLFANGQAVSTNPRSPWGARGQRGLWRSDGWTISVFLANGWTHQLHREDGEFRHAAHPPGPLKNPAPQPREARRVEGPETAFIGVWRLNKEPDGSYLYIALDSSGAAHSTIAGLTEGRWKLVNNAAVCTWPDGWVDRISVSDSGWQKTSWVGGDESTPADISEAVRVGAEAFEIIP